MFRPFATVLVVDPDANDRQEMADALTAEQFSVVGAATAEEGLTLLSQQGHDVLCIVADVADPEVSTGEFSSKVHKVDASMPVVLVTSWDTRDVRLRRHCRQLSCCVVSKAGMRSALVTLVRAAISSAQRHRNNKLLADAQAAVGDALDQVIRRLRNGKGKGKAC